PSPSRCHPASPCGNSGQAPLKRANIKVLFGYFFLPRKSNRKQLKYPRRGGHAADLPGEGLAGRLAGGLGPAEEPAGEVGLRGRPVKEPYRYIGGLQRRVQ